MDRRDHEIIEHRIKAAVFLCGAFVMGVAYTLEVASIWWAVVSLVSGWLLEWYAERLTNKSYPTEQ